MLSLAVLARETEDELVAAQLAQQLSLKLLTPGTALDEAGVQAVLLVTDTRLLLQPCGPDASGPVEVDFGSARMRHRRRGGANELLGKAVGVGKKRPLRVLDATAGLGRDAFVLADLGCDVFLRERNPVIAALLSNGLRRAQASEDEWLHAVASRMTFSSGDTRELDTATLDKADVIYLDPMFAERGKRAAAKKEMALFQRLLAQGHQSQGEEAEDAGALLAWALARDVARVVVKRPLKGAPLQGSTEPSHAIRGKAVRYDVYVRRKLG